MGPDDFRRMALALSPDFNANPFSLLSRLRSEQPVYRVTLPDKTPVWLAPRYALLANERFALQHPDQMEKLRRAPSLIKSVVEELLRFTSPVFMSTFTEHAS